MSISTVSLQKISRFRTEKIARLQELTLYLPLARLYANKPIETALNLLNQALGRNQKIVIVVKTRWAILAVKKIWWCMNSITKSPKISGYHKNRDFSFFISEINSFRTPNKIGLRMNKMRVMQKLSRMLEHTVKWLICKISLTSHKVC